jgi:hypothetical protein
MRRVVHLKRHFSIRKNPHAETTTKIPGLREGGALEKVRKLECPEEGVQDLHQWRPGPWRENVPFFD